MVRDYLELSKSVYDCKDIGLLKRMYENSTEIYNMPKAVLDSNFRCFFARLKNEKLYRPDNKDRMWINADEAYLMPEDSYWQLTSTEAYNRDSSARQDWNSKKIKNHMICTVFGGTKNMSLPPIHGVCYCFAGYDERALLRSAPWDLGGEIFADRFEAYRLNAMFKSKFCTPETQLKETIRRHNEDELERKSYTYGLDNIFKLQPSYTASFVELSLETYFNRALGAGEVLTAETLKSIVDDKKMNDRFYRQTVITKALEKDDKWKKTVDDAKQKKIQKCIVDMTHDLINERLRMDKKEEELLQYSNDDLNDPNAMQRFTQLIEEIIVEFDQRRAGVIQHEVLEWNEDGSSNSGDLLHKELYEKLFSRKVMSDKIQKMENKFKSLDESKYKACMKKMKEVSGIQTKKLENQYWWYECDTSYDCKKYYQDVARELSGITPGNDKQVIQGLLDMNVGELGMTGGQAVKKTIEEIKNLREYDIPDGNPDWHGRRHINDVVLFSYLIAKNEGKIGNNMDLVLQAAKYHDVGRDGMWNGLGEGRRHDEDVIPHAYPSAQAAEFYMKKELNPDGSRKYSDSQISMVKVAIEYHEVNENNKNVFNTDVFLSLCKQEKVRPDDLELARTLCVYLKDADALDRTRFIIKDDKAMFSSEYKDNLDIMYLRTNSAIALRDYARSINDIHYKNTGSQLYVPSELDKYTIPTNAVSQAQDWNVTKAEIRNFIRIKGIKKDEKEFSKQDIAKFVESTQSKGLLFNIRRKIRAFIEKIRHGKGDKER